MSEKKVEEKIDFRNYNFKLRDKINDYLKKMIAWGGSDLHVKAKSTIRARKDGKISPFPGWIISSDESRTLAKEILKSEYSKFVELKEFDTVHKYNEKFSFRVNFFFKKMVYPLYLGLFLLRYLPLKIIKCQK